MHNTLQIAAYGAFLAYTVLSAYLFQRLSRKFQELTDSYTILLGDYRDMETSRNNHNEQLEAARRENERLREQLTKGMQAFDELRTRYLALANKAEQPRHIKKPKSKN